MMNGLTSIDVPQSLSRIAYSALRKAIVEGQLKPGVIYNEMKLAKGLGISRTPVREALLELSAHGLVSFLPRRGVVVNQYTPNDVVEIFEVRRVIETASIEKACLTRTQEDLANIQTLIEKQRAALNQNDLLNFMKADKEFHLFLTGLTKNRRMVSILENLRDMFQIMGLRSLNEPGRSQKVIDEHLAICQALSMGSGDLAKQAMSAHLENTRKAQIEQLGKMDNNGSSETIPVLNPLTGSQ
jgi:GntR family transcriptional regulator, rspAB operon transcriptional repressor